MHCRTAAGATKIHLMDIGCGLADWRFWNRDTPRLAAFRAALWPRCHPPRALSQTKQGTHRIPKTIGDIAQYTGKDPGARIMCPFDGVVCLGHTGCFEHERILSEKYSFVEFNVASMFCFYKRDFFRHQISFP